jgi:amidophosphoribosyltransferase
MRISSPPTQGPCYYGIDTPQRRELIANRNSIDGIRRYIEADSLRYLTEEGLLRAVGETKGASTYCAACFTLEYPIVTRETEAVSAAV